MRKIIKLLLIPFLMIIFGQKEALAQVDTTAAPSPGDVIELDVSEIKIKIETPQVTLFSDRIEPEFDEVHLEKSFVREIIGEGERFEFDVSQNKKLIKQIDVDKMLKKVR